MYDRETLQKIYTSLICRFEHSFTWLGFKEGWHCLTSWVWWQLGADPGSQETICRVTVREEIRQGWKGWHDSILRTASHLSCIRDGQNKLGQYGLWYEIWNRVKCKMCNCQKY